MYNDAWIYLWLIMIAYLVINKIWHWHKNWLSYQNDRMLNQALKERTQAQAVAEDQQIDELSAARKR